MIRAACNVDFVLPSLKEKQNKLLIKRRNPLNMFTGLHGAFNCYLTLFFGAFETSKVTHQKEKLKSIFFC